MVYLHGSPLGTTQGSRDVQLCQKWTSTSYALGYNILILKDLRYGDIHHISGTHPDHAMYIKRHHPLTTPSAKDSSIAHHLVCPTVYTIRLGVQTGGVYINVFRCCYDHLWYYSTVDGTYSISPCHHLSHYVTCCGTCCVIVVSVHQ